jgi:ribosome-associated translation inhibitor RaiA
MKLTTQHVMMRSTDAIDSLIEEKVLGLQAWLQIDEAIVRVEHRREDSPAFYVSVHLVTPGPDVRARSRGHTVRSAIEKVTEELTIQARDRKLRHRPGMKFFPRTGPDTRRRWLGSLGTGSRK